MSTLTDLHAWLDANHPHHRDLNDSDWDALVATWPGTTAPTDLPTTVDANGLVWRTVHLAHTDCPRCTAAVASAIAHARVTGSTGATWRETRTNYAGHTLEHAATVTRKAPR